MNTYTHLGLDDARDEMIRMEKLEQARRAVNGEKIVSISQMAVKAVLWGKIKILRENANAYLTQSHFSRGIDSQKNLLYDFPRRD